MADVAITKFPVVAQDGTEYRVKIEEWRDSLIGPCVTARLYVRRKRWGFRNVYALTLYSYHQQYDPDDLDYVALARELIANYYDSIAAKARWNTQKAEASARKQAAVDRFNAWDGRIETEVSTDETR